MPPNPAEPFSAVETEHGEIRGRDLAALGWLAWEVGSDSQTPQVCSPRARKDAEHRSARVREEKCECVRTDSHL